MAHFKVVNWLSLQIVQFKMEHWRKCCRLLLGCIHSANSSALFEWLPEFRTSHFVFISTWDTLILYIFYEIELHIFWDDLTDVSAIPNALFRTCSEVIGLRVATLLRWPC